MARGKVAKLKAETKGLPGLDSDGGNYECPDKKCKNGGTLQSCKCICSHGWKGEFCQYCTIEGGPKMVEEKDDDDDTEVRLGEAKKKKKKGKKLPAMIGKCG